MNSPEESGNRNLRDDVTRKIGELVLAEIEFKVDALNEDDTPSKAKIFHAVRDDLADEIKVTNAELQDLYHWAKSGPLFANIWEQWVRLHPEQEPWPDNTEAEKWRNISYKLPTDPSELTRLLRARLDYELPPS